MIISFEIKEKLCLIDHDDLDLMELSWQPTTNHRSNTTYLIRGRKGNASMHRVILSRIIGRQLLPNERVDHKDLDGLNNTRANLRIATQSQNLANRTVQANNQLKVKGVRKKNSGYEARIKVYGTPMYLGVFPTIELAQAAYREAAKKHYGEFARFE